MSDISIIKAILDGDSAQYETLVTRYIGLIRSVCGSYEYESAACEDLIQETFIEAYMNLNRLRDGNRFGPWIAQIARNKSKTWMRQQVRRREVHEELAAQPVTYYDNTLLSDLSNKEIREWIRVSIHKLPHKTREAMLLFYCEGYTIQEAARCLAIHEAALKKRLQYGRERIGEQLCSDLREDLSEQSDDQSKAQTRSIVLALPLASAPWLGGGAAATGFSGMGVVLSWWKVMAVVVLLAGGGVLTLSGEPEEGVLGIPIERTLNSRGNTGPTLGGKNKVANQPLNDVVDIPNEKGFGSIEVEAVFGLPAKPTPIVEQPSMSDSTAVESVVAAQAPMVASTGGGQIAAVGLTVVAIPVEVRPNPAFPKYLNDLGFSEDEKNFVIAQYKRGGEASYTQVDIEKFSKSLNTKFNAAEVKGIKKQHKSLFSPDYAQAVYGRTDRNGQFTFEELATGLYWVQALTVEVEDIAHVPPGTRINRKYITVQANTIQRAEYILPDDVSYIHGVLIDKETREPLSHKSIQISGEALDNPTLSISTNAKGEFEFRHNVGYGAFTFSMGEWEEEYTLRPVSGVRKVGKPSVWTLEAEAMASIHGRVLFADGRPAPHITLMRQKAGGNWNGKTRSDAEGRYRVSHDGGLVSLYASKLSAKSETIEFQLERDESVEHDFILPPVTSVIIDAYDRIGNRPAEVNHIDLGRKSHNYAGNNLLDTMEDGRFVLAHLIPDEYTLKLQFKGYRPVETTFVVDESLHIQTIHLDLTPATLTARIRVMNEQGSPLHKYSLRVMEVIDKKGSYSNDLDYFSIDEDGYCVVKNLWPGKFEFSYHSSQVNVDLPQLEEIVLVVDEKEFPSSDYFLLNEDHFEVYDEQEPEIKLINDNSSYFVVPSNGKLLESYDRQTCLPGVNQVYVSKLGYSGAVFTVETDEAGQRITEEPYSVTLTQGSTLYGSVSDDMGEPLADRNIYVIPAVVWEQRTESTQHRIEELGQLIAQREHTDEHGLFALPYIPEGEYYVYVASNWNPCKGSTEEKEPMWAGPFELLPGYETGPVDLVIPKK